MSSFLKDNSSSLGIIIFFILYGLAANLYPGGSQADSNSIGFDWFHNYWCDLMSTKLYNGNLNPSYSTAVLAMAILCGSLFLFFMKFANTLLTQKLWKNTLKVSGGVSMILALLIATSLHNSMIIASSLFGLIAILIIIKTLFQTTQNLHKSIALLCILLLILNNLFYYKGLLIDYLPFLQKASFAIILIWIISLNQLLINIKPLLPKY
jgi:hypothetical protein